MDHFYRRAFWRLKLFICIAFALLFSISSAAETNKHLRLGIDDFSPYTMQHGERRGYVVDIVTETYQLAGYSVDVVFLPWKRALLKVEEKQLDGVIAAYVTDDRKNFLSFSEFSVDTHVLFAKLKNRPIKFTSLEDLSSYKIGVLKGSAHFEGEFYDAEYLDKQVIRSHEQALKLLMKQRFDLLVSQKVILDYTINTELPSLKGEIEYLSPNIVNMKAFHAIGKHRVDHPELLNSFDEAFKKLKANGRYQEILVEYGIE